MSMPWRQRFEFASRQTLDRGQGLSSFLSRLSVLGLILAVAVLLAVLSVMNGFERELEQRILGLLPHVTVRGFGHQDEWVELEAALSADLAVTGITLFHERQALVVRGAQVAPAALLGLPAHGLTPWLPLVEPEVARLPQGDMLVGQALAVRLGIVSGDRLRLIVPRANLGPNEARQPVPVQGRVAGLIRSGTELDEALIVADFDFVSALGQGVAIANGIALQLNDLFQAPEYRWQLERRLPPQRYATDWTSEQGNLYSAIQLSRDLVTLLLLSIIAVAAFNVVSSLVLVVKDRQGAIAMLRAMGASTVDVTVIFLMQGAMIGVLGATIGLALGALLALSAPAAASGLEKLLAIQLLSTDVYPLSFLPVDVRLADATLLWLVSVGLCVLAAVLPARRAARLEVAAVLANHGP